MTSLGPETVAYGIVAVLAIAVFAGGAYDCMSIPDRPRIAYVLVALSAGTAITAVGIFVAAYWRLQFMGMLTPKVGAGLRSGIESGVVVGVAVSLWWRFFR